MNEITKFLWYGRGENYIEIDNNQIIIVNMTKKDMKYYAEKLGVEFKDKSRW